MSVIDLEKKAVSDGELSSQQPSDHTEVNIETLPPGGDSVVDERTIHGIKWALAVMAILTVDFLFALDNTILADVQPNIINTFGEIEKLPWVAVTFILPSAALILPWSKAYSVFNIKRLFIAHVLLFEIGSAITGAAPTMNVFLIGKSIAGAGSCGMYIGSVSYLSVMTSTKERPMYISLITPVWGLGTVLGPIVGGAIAVSRATWRWGFYLNLVIGVVFAPIILFLLPAKDLQPNTSIKDKLKQNDFLGIVVWTGWNIAFAMAINFGGIVYAWNSPSDIVLWVMVAILMVVFILTQKFHPFVTARNKLYPTHLLTNWKLVNLQWQTFAAVGIVQVPLYYIPLFFQFTQKFSALQAAVCLLPFVFMIVISSLLSGQLMARLGYYMPWYVFAGATTLVGNALMCTLTPTTPISAVYGYSVLFGLGGGCTLLNSFAIAPALVAPKDEYNAIGCVSVAQSVGNVFFIATASNIFQNLGVAYVAPLVPPALSDNVRPLIAGTSSVLFEKLSASVRDDVTAAIIRAMDMTYPLLAAASALCLILAPFLGYLTDGAWAFSSPDGFPGSDIHIMTKNTPSNTGFVIWEERKPAPLILLDYLILPSILLTLTDPSNLSPMALTAFPALSKQLRLRDGTTYAYVRVPAAAATKPTFLLLHGFPSSCWDWRHQIAQLTEAGYGVVAPDLLGYGDTDKPRELEAYAMKRMSGHVVEILEREGLGKVVGVAHDWGVGLLSRLVNYHSERFLGIVTVSVSYVEPGLVWDIDAFVATTKEAFGYSTFGYWKWFNTDEADKIFDRNPKAAFSLIYPTDPELWRTDFCPVGGAAAYIAAGKTTPLPAYVKEEENAVRDQIMAQGGYTGPLSWYKAAMRGINHTDEANVPHESKFLTLPNLLVVSTKDYATRADMQEQRSREWVRDLKVVTLDCGHWIQLEMRDELVELLKGFADEVGAAK